MKTCERCQTEVKPGERFCPYHKRQVIAEMKQAGYLTNPIRKQPKRNSDARENIRETRRGLDE